MSNESAEIRRVLIDAMIAAAEAQLRALRRLRDGEDEKPKVSRTSRSGIGVVENILRGAGKPLHIRDIIALAQSDLGTVLDRESIVSALSKKVNRGDRFTRTAPNTFALKEGRG
jgi:hypothetical protein